MSNIIDKEPDAVIRKNHPHLYAYLVERLPQLGLDVETYGPYIWGVTDDFDDVTISSLQKDPDELQGIIDLLQGSSETHNEDDAVWEELRYTIQEKIGKDAEYHQTQLQERLQATKLMQLEQLEAAKREQEVNAIDSSRQSETSSSLQQQTVDDETKRLLLQRYGYEEPDGEEEEDCDAITTGHSANKLAAQQAHMEHANELRSQ